MNTPEQQYFASQPDSVSQARPFELMWRGRLFKFWTDSGVFSCGELDMGTRVLLDALPAQITGRVLDLGCGWGPVGVLLSAGYPQVEVWMADVNERAVALAQRNARENGVSARAVISDGLSQLDGAFDLIALNPPIRAGKAVIYRLFAEASSRLTAEGALYVVIRKQQGAPSAVKYLKTIFHDVCTIARKGGYHVIQCGGKRMQFDTSYFDAGIDRIGNSEKWDDAAICQGIFPFGWQTWTSPARPPSPRRWKSARHANYGYRTFMGPEDIDAVRGFGSAAGIAWSARCRPAAQRGHRLRVCVNTLTQPGDGVIINRRYMGPSLPRCAIGPGR